MTKVFKAGMFGALVAAFSLLATAPAAAETTVSCSCEHFASPYDGICNAYPWPEIGDETYEWTSWGAAYMPWPTPPTQAFAYYDIMFQGCRGGLDVRVTNSAGTSVWMRCSFGTGGAMC